MLTMLLIRPGTVWLMLYCSASRTRSALRYGDPGGKSGITTPPCKIGNGAYGASVATPGFGVARGAGSGGNAARGPVCAVAAIATSAVSNIFFVMTLRQNYITGSLKSAVRHTIVRIMLSSAQSC